MQPKPSHLGPEYASQFKDASVVRAYRHRPPYPPQTFEVLRGLIRGEPRTVLDIGCGCGDLARRLARYVDHIDAVDFSKAMIEEGKRLPDGDYPTLRWILGPVETAELDPPYGLVVAGASLHWMDWYTVLPRLARVLLPSGYLAIVNQGEESAPWTPELLALISRCSTNREYTPYDLIEELTRRDLFELVGKMRTRIVPVRQSVEEYVESIHSQNGFSRERMTPEAAKEFDRGVEELLRTHAGQDVERQVFAEIVWGYPRA